MKLSVNKYSKNMEEFLKQKGILIDVEIYSNDGRKYTLTELMINYQKYLNTKCKEVVDLNIKTTINYCTKCGKHHY